MSSLFYSMRTRERVTAETVEPMLEIVYHAVNECVEVSRQDRRKTTKEG